MSVSEEELKQINEKISEELEPFLDGIRTMGSRSRNFRLFKEAYNDFLEKHSRALTIAELLIKVKVEPTNELVEDLMELFTCMGFVESVGNTIVNFIVMLLVANGRDFHIECRYTTPRIKHAVSIKDLEDERVPLTTKLNFLRDNGITELASIIDSELRNRIAHLEFDVRKDRIYIKGKPAFEFAKKSSDKLLHAVLTTLKLVSQLEKEKGLTKKGK